MTISSISANDGIDYIDDNVDLISNENNIVETSYLNDENSNPDDINQLNNSENINNYSVNSNTNNSSINRNYNFVCNDFQKYYGNSAPYTITILDSNGGGVSGISVVFYINGNSYVRTTNSLGIASVAINLNSGTYGVDISIESGISIAFHKHITILPTITGNDITKYYKNGTQYYATFYDSNGVLLSNTQVTFNINGVIYTRTTNASGVAQLNINLNPGVYTLTATNPSTGEMHSNTVTVLTTLTASNLVMNQGDGSQFKARLVDGQGNPYSGQPITFNINGVFYTRYTNSNGIQV